MWVQSLGLGRSPGVGNGNPLRYPCLENSMDRGAWWATVHRFSKRQIRTCHRQSLDAACSREVSSLCPFTPFDENLKKSSYGRETKVRSPSFRGNEAEGTRVLLNPGPPALVFLHPGWWFMTKSEPVKREHRGAVHCQAIF